jgi:hypothetical protein
MKALFGMLLLCGVLFSIANVTTEGGNVTNVYFNQTQNSTHWDGVYGDVVLGAGVTYTHTVNGNGIVLLNIVGQDPPCTYTGLSMHIIAVNNSVLALPLAAGNLAQLDAFIGGSQNGSTTFTALSNFVLNSGTYNNVPTAYSYANGAPSPDFREGYLNDALGNLVFIADVVSDQPNWNGSTSDYQIMLPNNGSGVQYWLWVEVNYTCVPPTPPDGGKDHKLYVPPIPAQEMQSGTPFELNITVENRGDYREDDVEVSITNCPDGFACGIALIPKISKWEEEQVALEIDGGSPGSYVLEVCAENDDADYCREFILNVLPECEEGECPEDEYCENGEWVGKHEAGEPCEDDCWCLSGICENGVCVLCETDEDCDDDEQCSDGYCEMVECPCGIVKDHACIPYECCSDGDCEATEFCINLECVPKELELVFVEGSKVEGDVGFFQILNNKGEGVAYAGIFTEGGASTVDGNGYGSIEFPYDGIVYADAEGYGQAASLYEITRLGFILVDGGRATGEEAIIRIVDSREMPIAGATVFLEGKTYTADANGEIRHIFQDGGSKKITAEKTGYMIKDMEVMIEDVGVEAACYFPVLLNLFEIPAPQLWMLWAVSLALAVFNFIFFRKRVFMKFLKKTGSLEGEEIAKAKRELDFGSLAYSAAPLLVALPDYWILNICFMSNIVLLQAIREIVLIMKIIVEKKGK